jgi:hypothetical protein
MRNALIVGLFLAALVAVAQAQQSAACQEGESCQYAPYVERPLVATEAVPTRGTVRPTRTSEPTTTPTATTPLTTTPDAPQCAPEYPGVCISPPPPDLDCGDIVQRNFVVLEPDRHNFDTDGDGIGCESA